MVNQERLVCNCCLVGAVIYGFVSGSVGSGKNFGIASLAIYGVSGIVVIVAECISNNEKMRKIDMRVTAVKTFAALDLLTAEVLVSVAQVDMMMAALTLIPAALDVLFYFWGKDWSYVTPWWHIADVVAFVVIGVKDTKYILIPGAIFFLLAVFGVEDNKSRDYVALTEAIGLFCVVACIGGKDLKDFGIPIGG